MAAPAVNHFWEIEEAAALKIAKIAEKGDNHPYEDVVWHAWDKIPRPYFPERAGTAAGPRYSIEREAYRGPPGGPLEHKPDVIVVRISNVQQAAGQRPIAAERDVLWIECKASVHLRASGWHTVLLEAVQRLDSAHPDRVVFLILAVGLKWMPFKWDPLNPLSAAQKLEMLTENGQEVWADIDRRIRPVVLSQQPNSPQPYIKDGRFIDTARAYTLNYWDLDANGDITHFADLQLLETLFNYIQGTAVLHGFNPPNF